MDSRITSGKKKLFNRKTSSNKETTTEATRQKRTQRFRTGADTEVSGDDKKRYEAKVSAI